MAAKRETDSKQGLIITVVICVLLILGLGVATYYGFAGQQELEAKMKEAQKAKDSMSKIRDWERYKGLIYKAYGGLANEEELAELGGIRGPNEAQRGQGEKDKAANDAAIQKLDDRTNGLGWDETQRKPLNTYAKLVDTLKNDLKAAREAQLASDAKNKTEFERLTG